MDNCSPSDTTRSDNEEEPATVQLLQHPQVFPDLLLCPEYPGCAE